MINSNMTRNSMLFYCHLDVTIDYFPVFFDLVFKVNLDDFQKKQVNIINIIIFLKSIDSKFTRGFVQ